MKNSRLILLATLLKSTGSMNTLKYSKDVKKKKQVRGNLVGKIVLYVFLLAFCVLMSVGYGIAGLTDAIPLTAVMTISLLGFVFTLLKTNGYLFAFKEYDMLMAMPISVRDIVADKFLYMYFNSLPIMVITSISMMIGYGIYAKPGVAAYIIWVLLSFVAPLIPMILASAIGALFAKIGTGFRHKKLIQTILLFIFVILCMCSRFIIEKFARDGQEALSALNDVAGALSSASGWYVPARWFMRAVTECNILYALLCVTVSVVLFEVVILIVSRSYRQINSGLTSSATKKNYQFKKQSMRSVPNTVAFKEFKRFMGTQIYLVNVGLGEIFVALLGIVALFVDADKLIQIVTQGAPLTKEMLMPAIPSIIYFFLGMVATTCCSPSLEGKNFWIVKSMPVKAMDLLRGKMRFNMYLTMPFMVFATIALGFSADAPLVDIVLYLLNGTAFLLFSTTLGMIFGIKHIRLDWENEIEVVKQGPAVGLYLLVNMILTMGLTVGSVALGTIVSGRIVTVGITIVIGLFALIFNLRIKSMAAHISRYFNV